MVTVFLGLLRARSPRRRAARSAHHPTLERLDDRCLLDAGMGYVQSNLASDVPGLAPHTNPKLINPWGFSETSDGQFRVAANGSGRGILFDAEGAKEGTDIIIPPPAGSSGGTTSTPNGVVSNTTSGFVITDHGRSAPATLLFSTEDGTIAGWNPAVNQAHAVIAIDQSGDGAVYKLLALGTNSQGTFIYATDFHNGVVDVFDEDFKPVTFFPGQFTDSSIPDGFAPFGVKNFNNTLFVTFAKQDAAKHDDVAGVGNGFIDEFSTTGVLLGRFASQGTLNSPIGATIAPDNFGKFSNDVLIGNFGDSKVNVFTPAGEFVGQLTDTHGNPLILNGGFKETDTKGLWGIGFGNGSGGAGTNTLFFAAGINEENDGLFGKVTVGDGDQETDDSTPEAARGLPGAAQLNNPDFMGTVTFADNDIGTAGSSKHHRH